jgi:hypothetical protein
MAERLMAKLDRLGAEAGIKQMTPEMYRFAHLLNEDKLKQWDEWRSQRTWVGLTAEDRLTAKYMQDAPDGIEAVIDYIEAKLKEKNT